MLHAFDIFYKAIKYMLVVKVSSMDVLSERAAHSPLWYSNSNHFIELHPNTRTLATLINIPYFAD